MEIISNSEKETIELGKKIAEKLEKGMVIVLTGDLGSGKTKLTEGILTYFGLENEISSPTFTIVNEYYTENLNLYHFDVYRLSDIDEFYAIGGEEYFEKGASIIEWGEMIEEAYAGSGGRYLLHYHPAQRVRYCDRDPRNLYAAL